jgi:peptide/nickel transport system substrate-binding protein
MIRFLVLAVLFATPAAAQSTLTVGITGLSPNVFNPYSNTGLPFTYSWSAVFDGLTFIDDRGEVRPWLAESWDNPDPLTWRFKLRDGVSFSDGSPLTADAAVAVGEIMTAADTSANAVVRMMSFLAGVRALDARTVEITTKTPVPLLPRFLPQFYIGEPNRLRRLGLDRFAREPVATGPFALESFAPNKATFRAHAGSWRRPKFDRLDLLVVPDSAARRAAVQSGTMDIALGLGPEETASIVAGGGRQFTWRDNALWAYHFNGLGGNPYRYAPFNDIRVREALNIAIDREAVIASLLDNQTVAATQPATESSFGFNADLPPIPYDPERARRLLAEAGHARGLDIVLEVTVGASANDSAIAQAVAQQLATVGVKVDVRQISTLQLIRNVMEGTWGEAMFGLHYSLEPTADALRGLDTASCLWHHPWYCNPATTADIQAAHAATDRETQLALRHKVMAAYRADWPAIFMHQAVRFAGAKAGIGGFTVMNNYILYDRIERK